MNRRIAVIIAAILGLLLVGLGSVAVLSSGSSEPKAQPDTSGVENGEGDSTGEDDESETPPAVETPNDPVTNIEDYKVDFALPIGLAGGYRPTLAFGCSGIEFSLKGPEELDVTNVVGLIDGDPVRILDISGTKQEQKALVQCPENLELGEVPHVFELSDGEKRTKPFNFIIKETSFNATAESIEGSPGEAVTVTLKGDVPDFYSYSVKAVALPTSEFDKASLYAADEIDLKPVFDVKKKTITFGAADDEDLYYWVSIIAEQPGDVTTGLAISPFQINSSE